MTTQARKGDFIRSVPINRPAFARNLRAEMRNQSLTAQMLANKSGVAEPTIKMMCGGYAIKNSPNVALYTLVGLADGLGIKHDVVVAWACDCVVARRHLLEAQQKAQERIARRKTPGLTVPIPAPPIVTPPEPKGIYVNTNTANTLQLYVAPATVASVMLKVRKLNSEDLALIDELISELT